MIVGFESAAIRNGYIVNVCNGRDHADPYFEHVFTRGIDGFLIKVLPYRFQREKLLAFLKSGMHAVLFGNHGIDTADAACFEIGYLLGMELAVEHLHALGHRRIAYLSGLTRRERYDRRITGFTRAMKRRGLAARGLRVPGDVSVVGIDNASVAAVVTPALITVASDHGALGRTAFELLHDHMVNGRHGYILHPPHLPLGIGMSDECVWDELDVPPQWGRFYWDPDMHADLCRRYSDRVERRLEGLREYILPSSWTIPDAQRASGI